MIASANSILALSTCECKPVERGSLGRTLRAENPRAHAPIADGWHDPPPETHWPATRRHRAPPQERDPRPVCTPHHRPAPDVRPRRRPPGPYASGGEPARPCTHCRRSARSTARNAWHPAGTRPHGGRPTADGPRHPVPGHPVPVRGESHAALRTQRCRPRQADGIAACAKVHPKFRPGGRPPPAGPSRRCLPRR